MDTVAAAAAAVDTKAAAEAEVTRAPREATSIRGESLYMTLCLSR